MLATKRPTISFPFLSESRVGFMSRIEFAESFVVRDFLDNDDFVGNQKPIAVLLKDGDIVLPPNLVKLAVLIRPGSGKAASRERLN